MKILIVDDEPLISRAVTRLLPDLEFVSAHNGTKALEEYGLNGPFDAALVDYFLGDCLGVELADRLLELQPDLHVVITGGALPAVVPYPTLEKPFTADELRAALVTDFLH